MEKENKFEDKNTTELLDFIGKKFNYKEDKKRDLQEDMLRELDDRRPFNHMKRKIEYMEREIKDLKEAVRLLLVHKHEGGQVVVPIQPALQK